MRSISASRPLRRVGSRSRSRATASSLTERMSTEWLATLRGRVGYTPMPQLLLYATGGIAFTDFKFSSSYADNATRRRLARRHAVSAAGRASAPAGPSAAAASGCWTAGWSIRAEYLYVDFGSERIAVPTSNTPAFHARRCLSTPISRRSSPAPASTTATEWQRRRISAACARTAPSRVRRAEWDLPAERLAGVRALITQLVALAAKAKKAA